MKNKAPVCKYGMWTCAWKRDQEVCQQCQDADSYEPDPREFNRRNSMKKRRIMQGRQRIE